MALLWDCFGSTVLYGVPPMIALNGAMAVWGVLQILLIVALPAPSLEAEASKLGPEKMKSPIRTAFSAGFAAAPTRYFRSTRLQADHFALLLTCITFALLRSLVQ